MSIVLILIYLTIFFERVKEFAEERADRNLRPIVDKVFGEMTVLGFLSMFSFAIAKTGVYNVIGELTGEGNEVEEIFEFVHYSLFIVMVFFVLQVTVLVVEAEKTEQQWLEMDIQSRNNNNGSNSSSTSLKSMASNASVGSLEDCSNLEHISSVTSLPRGSEGGFAFRKKIKFAKTNPIASSFRTLLPGFRDLRKESATDTKLFALLREEFILDRSVDPPFQPVDHLEPLTDDFNFGRYLGQCLGHFLCHVVELSEKTWILFAISSILYYGYLLLVDGNMMILAWSWAAMAWMVYLFNIVFERHLIELRNKFAKPEKKRLQLQQHLQRLQNHHSHCENTALLGDVNVTFDTSVVFSSNGTEKKKGDKEEKLPGWTQIDIDEYIRTRPWWIQWIAGRKPPNRQQAMFWFDTKGIEFYAIILQVNLLFTGLYSAVIVYTYVPYMFPDNRSSRAEWLQFFIYIIVSLAPVFGLVLSKKHLVATLVQVCSVGVFRKPQVIAKILREEKTVHVVRTFIIIYKLRRFATLADKISNANGRRPQRKDRIHYRLAFDESEIQQVGKAFDMFDRNRNGSIDYDEFKSLMESLGSHKYSDKSIHAMIDCLDDDKNGVIDREEFIQWYADQMLLDNQIACFHDHAKFMFELFDDDNSGTVTLSEFQNKLEMFNFGFTIDEIGRLVNELDEDHDGTISEKEFKRLLDRYLPHEIKDWEDAKRRYTRISMFRSALSETL